MLFCSEIEAATQTFFLGALYVVTIKTNLYGVSCATTRDKQIYIEDPALHKRGAFQGLTTTIIGIINPAIFPAIGWP